MEKWRGEESHNTQTENGTKNRDKSRKVSNNSTIKDNLTSMHDGIRHKSVRSRSKWGPRLSTTSKLSSRLGAGSSNGFANNDQGNSTKMSSNHCGNVETRIRKNERSLFTGKYECSEKALTESLAHRISRGKDAADADALPMRSRMASVSQHHRSQTVTSGNEPKHPTIALKVPTIILDNSTSAKSLNDNANIFRSKETVKTPHDDKCLENSSMSMSDDSSVDPSGDAPRQKRTGTGNATSPIYLSSDKDSFCSAMSMSSSQGSGKSQHSTSSTACQNKQSSDNHHTISANHMRNNTTSDTLKGRSLSYHTTTTEPTSSITESSTSMETSSQPHPKKELNTTSMTSSSSTSISQIKHNRWDPISPPITDRKNQNSTCQPISTPSRNKNMQSLDRKQDSSISSTSTSPKVRDMKLADELPSSLSSSVNAITKSKNIALSSLHSVIPQSKIIRRSSSSSPGNIPPSIEAQSSSTLSLGTISKNRTTSSSDDTQSLMSFSRSIISTNMKRPQPNKAQSSLSSPSVVSNERDTIPSAKTQNPLDSSNTGLKKKETSKSSDTKDSSSQPPSVTVEKKNVQASNDIQSSSCCGVSKNKISQPLDEQIASSLSQSTISKNTHSISTVPKKRNSSTSSKTMSSSSCSQNIVSKSKVSQPSISSFSGPVPKNKITFNSSEQQSMSSSSPDAISRFRNTHSSKVLRSSLISSLNAISKNRNTTKSHSSSFVNDNPKNRNTLATNGAQCFQSSSFNPVSKSKTPPQSNGMQSFSPSATNSDILPSNETQNYMESFKKVTRPSDNISPPTNINTLSSNEKQTSAISNRCDLLIERQNLSHSPVEVDSINKNNKKRNPFMSNSNEKLVGSVNYDSTDTKAFESLDSISNKSLAGSPLTFENDPKSPPKQFDNNLGSREVNSSENTKSSCLSEILDEKCYKILRKCDIFTLNDLHSCEAKMYTDEEQIVIDRAKSLTEGNRLDAWMRIRGRRISKNNGKGRLTSGATSQMVIPGNVDSRNELSQALFESTCLEFLKSEGIYTREDLLSFTVENLTCKYDKWRSKYLDDQTKSSPLTIANWQLIARSCKSGYILKPSRKRRRNFSAMSDQNISDKGSVLERDVSYKHRRISDADNLRGMNDVDCKTKPSSKDGRPVMLITAMNHETESLYDFRLYTGKSLIPNSGLGAFMTYEGARLLKPEAARRSKQLMKGRYPVDVPTSRVLEAKGTDGMNVSVLLEGDNLHGNGNSPYFRVTRFPLKAILQNGDSIRVTIGPATIHEDIDLLRKNNEIPYHIDGLGHFKINTKDDYVESEEDFCSHSDGCGLIDIGRYGPFLHSDRKTTLEFNLKDFVFNHEPAAWNFGVSEKLKGSGQIIDVTSDSTGETHRVAKAHLPMYVNEVGHNTELCQNIMSREKDDRVVNYYLYIQKPMKKGQTVELLTNYGDKYEETRERKGYGKANIECGLKDDFDDNTRMRHNISNRNSVEITIKSMTLEEIEETLQFLVNKIYNPLTEKIEWITKMYFEYIGKGRDKFVEVHQLSSRQWRAWRRLSWLGMMFQKRVDILTAGSSQHGSIEIINNIVHKMKWKCDNILIRKLQAIKGKGGEIILDEIKSEIFEENLFLVSKSNHLIHTFDESLWCATARKLVTDIAEKTIPNFKLEGEHMTERQLKRLAADLEELAANAISSIRDACNKLRSSNTTLCYFDSAVQSLYFSEIRDDLHQEKLLDAYQDAMKLGCMKACISIKDPDFSWNISSKFLRTKNNENGIHNSGENYDFFSEILHDLQLLQSGAIRVDENWYVLWQVVRVVHYFATRCVEWNIEGNSTNVSIYSLESLCERVGINVEDARKMLCQEMVPRLKPNINRRREQRKSTIGHIKYHQKGYKNKEDQPNYDERDKTLPEGWRLERVKRASSNHVDRYWYTKTNKKLRSRTEVKLLLNFLEKTNNNEDEAFQLLIEEKARLKKERLQRKRPKDEERFI